jgi:hypothetical protein
MTILKAALNPEWISRRLITQLQSKGNPFIEFCRWMDDEGRRALLSPRAFKSHRFFLGIASVGKATEGR